MILCHLPFLCSAAAPFQGNPIPKSVFILTTVSRRILQQTAGPLPGLRFLEPNGLGSPLDSKLFGRILPKFQFPVEFFLLICC